MGIAQPKMLCLFSSPLVKPNEEPLDIFDAETESASIIYSTTEILMCQMLAKGT
jgi:hypothetical protein